MQLKRLTLISYLHHYISSLVIYLSNLLVLLQSSNATVKALQKLQSKLKAVPAPSRTWPWIGCAPPLLRKGKSSMLPCRRHKAFSPVSWWRSNDCLEVLPVHFRVRMEHWLATITRLKFDSWCCQYPQLLAASCLQTAAQCWGELKKNWSSSWPPQIYSLEQRENLESVPADLVRHNENFSDLRNCFLTYVTLLGHGMVTSIENQGKHLGVVTASVALTFIHLHSQIDTLWREWKLLLKTVLFVWLQLKDE